MKTIFAVLAFLAFSFTAAAQKKNLKTETFNVSGACSMCKNRIEQTAIKAGAYNATWIPENNLLTVGYDSALFSKAKIQQQLAAVGHDTEEFCASNYVYENLPPCCHYPRTPKATPAMPTGKPDADRSGEKTITLIGSVSGTDKTGSPHPLSNATLSILGTTHTAITDSLGLFSITTSLPIWLAVSYVGYETDTLTISKPGTITVLLRKAATNRWEPVVVRAKNQSTYISSLSTFNTLNIGSKELAKAACCNLGESFETSPSVDVSYTDAVTGIKQIQLLGLSGNYTQLLTENAPEIKGLAGSYGLTFIPGPWIEGIQVTKGAGSVVNGYESIAGQINIEEKKPGKTDKLFINTYANSMGRLEANLNLTAKLNERWSTALLAHANGVVQKVDGNNDHFLDLPKGKQVNFINRWQYAGKKGLLVQFSLKALADNRQAGEMDFNPATDQDGHHYYGVGINIQQYSFTGKAGYVSPKKNYKSVGIIFSGSRYNNESYYGLTHYNGNQRSVYVNLIYQSIIGTTARKFRTGLSFANEQYGETVNAATYNRSERVPGLFFEYTHLAGKRLTLISGLRADSHNEYGLIITPRLHVKYDLTPKTNLRFSVGSGFRTANIFAENTGLFASARTFSIVNADNRYAYGLNPEKAWNYGVNFVRNFKLNGRAGTISADAYRTSFKNQVVVDVDAHPQKALFYNLNGKSYSNSLQAELNYELMHKLDLRLAYRWLEVQTSYHNVQLEKPLLAKHRAFINAAYETPGKWQFDITVQWLGRKRLPNTTGNPENKQMGNYSPSYLQMSAQVTKHFDKHWNVYMGVENITGFTQKTLFISGHEPFSPYFDGSIIWGPVNGRVLYAGMRFKLIE